MDVFYERSVKFVYKKSSRKHSDLREVCKEILKILKTEKDVHTLIKQDPEKYFRPFILACITHKSHLIEKGLDSIQKLTSYGYLTSPELISVVIKNICESFVPVQEDFVRIQIIKALLHLVLNLPNVHGKLLRDIIKTCFNIYLVSENQVIQKTSKASLTQILNHIFTRIEKKTMDGDPSAADKSAREFISHVVSDIISKINRRVTGDKFLNEYHKDGVLIFNALCRLSMKKVTDASAKTGKNSLELRNRVLSLELIQSILEHSGPVFRSSSYFLEDIKRILCISLLQNSVSFIPEIFEQALAIFKTLIMHFSQPLKKEIGMFFTNCFLQILESSYSSFVHKRMVLHVLRDVLRDRVLALFVSYDCSLEEVNIIEQTVYEICRLVVNARKFVKDRWMSVDEAHELRTTGIEIVDMLVTHVRRLIEEIHEKQDEEQKMQRERHRQRLAQHKKRQKSRVEKKSEKIDFREGVKLFNLSPAKGIDYLVKIGRLGAKPVEIATFLYTRSAELKISPDKIGEYLGSHHETNLSVLHRFVHLMDFRDLSFCGAFRKFLTSFRIPGEGQQIDRIVQKFAQVFMEQNASFPVFVNADSAYFFSYSVMLLHTDLHNPNIRFRERMSLADFSGLIQGGNEGTDFPHEFVDSVYNDIKATEIKINLPGQQSTRRNSLPSDATMSYVLNKTRKKELLFKNESNEIIKSTRKKFGLSWKAAALAQDDDTDNKFDRRVVIVTLFKVIWKPISDSVAHYMTHKAVAKHTHLIKHAVNVLENAFFVSSRLALHQPHETFVETLCLHTGLLSDGGVVTALHVSCIQLLTKLITVDRNNVVGWFHVLRVISCLDQLREIGRSPRKFLIALPEKAEKVSFEDIDFTKLSREDREVVTTQYFHHINYHKIFADLKAVEDTFIDNLFLNSNYLDDTSVVRFVHALVKLSDRELEMPDRRDFCLRKLIILGVDNINTRTQLVWQQLWGALSGHLIQTSCHRDENISMISIDALRQITLHFFGRREMHSFHFQKTFLRPYVHILRVNQNPDMRELLLDCIAHLIKSRVENIQSGWVSILDFFQLCTKDTAKTIVQKTYTYVKMCVREEEYFASLVKVCKTQFVKVVIELALNNVSQDIAQRSIALVAQFAAKVITPIIAGTEKKKIFGETHGDFWLPLLHGLSRLVHDDHPMELRIISLDAIFRLLRQNGMYFTQGLWGLVFKGCLLSLFDDINQSGDDKAQFVETDWMRNTCHKSLAFLVDTFVLFYAEMRFLFAQILALIGNIIHRDNERLCYIGSQCVAKMLAEAREKLPRNAWKEIIAFLADMVAKLAGVENSEKMVLDIVFRLLTDDEYVHLLAEEDVTRLLHILTQRASRKDAGRFVALDMHMRARLTIFGTAQRGLSDMLANVQTFLRMRSVESDEMEMYESVAKSVVVKGILLQKDRVMFGEIFKQTYDLWCDMFTTSDRDLRDALIKLFKMFK